MKTNFNLNNKMRIFNFIYMTSSFHYSVNIKYAHIEITARLTKKCMLILYI